MEPLYNPALKIRRVGVEGAGNYERLAEKTRALVSAWTEKQEQSGLTLGDIYKDLNEQGIVHGVSFRRPWLLLALEHERLDLVLILER